MPESLDIEVVYALKKRQTIVAVQLESGSTVADALAAAARDPAFERLEVDLAGAAVGVFGTIVSREYELRSGDRVEIYRPLRFDPKERRRELAAEGKTMSGAPRVER